MTNVVQRSGAFKGRHADYDLLNLMCCAESCKAQADEDAPVPLCPHHMRIAFAHFLMTAEGASAEVADPIDYEDDEQPVHDYATLNRLGFVYFVRFSDRIKIGWSGNPRGRFKNIPHDEVLAIVPGTMEDERQMHAMFARFRVTGEWFQAKRDLLDFIATLPSVA